ncbi:Uncharacterised protein [Pseudomonas aeruginosa]|nr:Uncharacterised protein [Pseudomonas aeruginosa]
MISVPANAGRISARFWLARSMKKGGHQAPISRFINYLGCEIAVSSIDGCIGPAEGEAGGTFCRVIGSFTGNWFTSKGSCAFGCDVGPGDGPPPGGDGGTGGDGGSNPPGGDGGSDGGTKPGNGGGDDGSSGGGGGGGGGNNPVRAMLAVTAAPRPAVTAVAAAMATGPAPAAGPVAMAATAPAGRPERAEARLLRQDHQGIRRRHRQGAKGLPGTARQVRKRPRFQVRYSPGHRRRLLPCWDFTALGQRYDVCLTQYAQELSVIRYVVLFIAAILAGWIVFYRS